jgi:cathepsin E
MLPTARLAFFGFLLFAVGVAANSVVIRQGPVTLPLARRVNVTGPNDLVQKDRARAKHIIANAQAKALGAHGSGTVVSAGVTNTGIRYEASVGIGNPATYCKSCRYDPHMESHAYFR